MFTIRFSWESVTERARSKVILCHNPFEGLAYLATLSETDWVFEIHFDAGGAL